ncbi:enoyl-CoA hydratase/isomerase family protein [Kitasatospora sp. NPDC002040]|uniref:enoyl-CoA hydratase/isomerase family protein n=1 Tax=Kitasatospora sp. NPDC002040 TaxID=3154661 RepID=UPI00332E4BB8
MNDLLVEQRGAVRWLRLNRPHRRNALDRTLIESLDRAFGQAEGDAGTAVVVIAGQGQSFCAGADLRHLLDVAEQGRDPVRSLFRASALFSRIETSHLPVVAAIHGHAVAGGLELALACDVVIAADDALIGDGHVRNQLLPAGGASVRLPRRLGANPARYLMLTGRLLPARDRLFSGWLHSTVPAADLYGAVQDVAEELAAAAGPAQARVKQLLCTTESLPAAAGTGAELAEFSAHWDATPVADALRAFLTDRREV